MTQPPSNDFPNGQVPGGQEPQVPDFGPPADPAQPSFDPTGQPGYAAPGAQQPAQGNQDYWEANAAQQPPQGVFDQAPKKKGILGKVGSIVVALLVAFGAYTAFQNFASDAALEPGNCLVISGESNDDVDHKLVDCDDADTYSYYVASVSKGDSSAGTCEGVEYESTVTKRGSTRTKSISCLIPSSPRASATRASTRASPTTWWPTAPAPATGSRRSLTTRPRAARHPPSPGHSASRPAPTASRSSAEPAAHASAREGRTTVRPSLCVAPVCQGAALGWRSCVRSKNCSARWRPCR